MTLANIKTMKEERGFTIVELLIVIVVIAILAAIVIVAYQGVTARANTSKAQTNAVTVQKKAEAYNADNSSSGGNGYYSASASAFTSVTGLGALPSGVTVQAGSPDKTNGTTAVRYNACVLSSNAVGYWIGYWDFTNNSVTWISGGTVGTTNPAGATPCAGSATISTT